MNDIEIVWVDEKNLIIKLIYNENIPSSRMKRHVNNIANSEFISNLSVRFNVMITECIRPAITTINNISMSQDGTTTLTQDGTTAVSPKKETIGEYDYKKIFFC